MYITFTSYNHTPVIPFSIMSSTKLDLFVNNPNKKEIETKHLSPDPISISFILFKFASH
jgi:hypothetical protein